MEEQKSKSTVELNANIIDKRSWLSTFNVELMWVMILGFLGIIYWQFFSSPFLKYVNLPFQVEVEVIHPGQPIPIKVKRCNSQDITRAYNSTRELLNTETGELTIMPAATVSVVPGCNTVVSKLTVLPTDTKPGNYRMQGTAEITDFMNVRLINWYTTTFKVP